MTTKLKRMLLCLGLVLSMSFLLFGCGTNNQNANATGAPEDTIDESIDESTDVAEGTEVVEEPSETTPEVSNDPLAPLKVTEDFAKSFGGIYLIRNGNMYALTGSIPRETSVTYNIGWRRNETYGILYKLIENESIEGTNYVSMGDVPVVTIQEGDEIRGYQYPGICLESATHTGYSLPMVEGAYDSTSLLIYADPDSVDPIIFSKSALENFQILDESDNPVDLKDIHNLEYGKNYTISWYENGTEYRELEMTADCHCYNSRRRNPTQPYEYDIDGELTKDGYAIIDLSGVEPGLYRIDVGFDGYIEIP